MKIIKQNKLISLVFMGAIIAVSVLTYTSLNSSKTASTTINPTPTPYCVMEDTKSPKDNKISKELYKKYTECKPVEIFLTDKATDEEINSFRSELSKTRGVYYLKYISKEEALENYKEQNKNDPLLLKDVSKDFLPASLEVYVSDPSLRPSIAGVAKNKSFIKKVLFGE